MSKDVRLAWRRFAELSADELYDLLRLRCEIFIVAQNSAYLDVDGRDRQALHLLALGQGGPLNGYLRLLPPAQEGGPATIGRVVTDPTARGSGLGRRLVASAIEWVNLYCPDVPIELAAQTHLEPFYRAFGFERVSADYLEDGIAHCDMRLDERNRTSFQSSPSLPGQ